MFGLLVSGTIMNIIIQSLGDNKKGQSGVSQQRYFYLSFQINDESKCTEKSYQIFLTLNSHMYSRDPNLWRPKIWRLSFLSLQAPPPLPPQNFNGSPPPHDPAPNGNDLGHFMKSYMKYILSNSQSSF